MKQIFACSAGAMQGGRGGMGAAAAAAGHFNPAFIQNNAAGPKGR